MRSLLFTSVLIGLPLLLVGSDTAAHVDKRAPEGCSNAHVILGWSKVDDAEMQKKITDKVWERVGLVLWARHRRFLGDNYNVDNYEKGKPHSNTFRQYAVKGHEGAVAYVGHCGTGATCNLIGDVFHRLYKRVGTPMVYCGAMPNILESPGKPKIPDADFYKDDDPFDDDIDWGDDEDDK